MTTEESIQSETEEEGAPPAPPAKEKPLIDLGEMLKRRGKGEGLGVAETILLMDYQDRQDERRYRRELADRQSKSSSPSPEVEAVKTEVSALKKTVDDLVETIRSERQEKAQKELIEGVVQQTTDKIMPELQAVKQKLEEYDQRIATGEEPSFSLEDLKESLKEMTDKLGEKVGAGGKTLGDVVNDVDKIMELVDSIEKRLRHGEGAGEVDYKTMAVSTVGEIGKELIGAYRDIATQSATSLETQEVEKPATTMQTVIKRQVQNYITQRMKAGATTMNIQEAANELGLTSGQVAWAYQTLMKEGWFHVRVPSKRKKVKEPGTPTEEGEVEAQEQEAVEEEQVFQPPTET